MVVEKSSRRQTKINIKQFGEFFFFYPFWYDNIVVVGPYVIYDVIYIFIHFFDESSVS